MKGLLALLSSVARLRWRMGGYVLLAYRTPWLNLTPYVTGEHSTYTNATFDGTGSTGLGKDDLPYFGTQVAWAF